MILNNQHHGFFQWSNNHYKTMANRFSGSVYNFIYGELETVYRKNPRTWMALQNEIWNVILNRMEPRLLCVWDTVSASNLTGQEQFSNCSHHKSSDTLVSINFLTILISLTSLCCSPYCRIPSLTIFRLGGDMMQQLCLEQDVATLGPRAHTLFLTRLHGTKDSSDENPFNSCHAIRAWLVDIPEGKRAIISLTQSYIG
jgi:hypothetical protein